MRNRAPYRSAAQRRHRAQAIQARAGLALTGSLFGIGAHYLLTRQPYSQHYTDAGLLAAFIAMLAIGAALLASD